MLRAMGIAFLTGLVLSAAGAWADFRPLTGGGGSSGDAKLTYRDGIVYDEDLVPGLPPNQPFLPKESGADIPAERADDAPARPNSPQLIGPDGRLRR